jgi:hypothetical protein
MEKERKRNAREGNNETIENTECLRRIGQYSGRS